MQNDTKFERLTAEFEGHKAGIWAKRSARSEVISVALVTRSTLRPNRRAFFVDMIVDLFNIGVDQGLPARQLNARKSEIHTLKANSIS